jgi:hypothetical protein
MNKTMLPSNWNQWALPVLAAAVALAILIFAADSDASGRFYGHDIVGPELNASHTNRATRGL